MGVVQALRFAAANGRSVVLVAARLVADTLLVMAPFLLLAGLIYRQLLTEFDINYYLKEWPGEFQLAVALGACSSRRLSRCCCGWRQAGSLPCHWCCSRASAIPMRCESAAKEQSGIAAGCCYGSAAGFWQRPSCRC